MKYVICNLERKKGIIQENQQKYDNVVMNLLLTEDDPMYYRNLLGGRPISEIKVKTELFDEIVFDPNKVVQSWNDLAWCEIELYIDVASGKVICIKVLDIDGKSKL